MALTAPRSLFFLAFVACLGLMAGALYLEHVVGLTPCPLCIVQRVLVIAFALVCLLAALHNRGRRIYSGFALLFAVLGAATAGRQVWLQGVPADQLGSCLPSLEFMVQALPLQEIVRLVLHGTADCAEVSWTFLDLSVPHWSLIAFVCMGGGALVQLLRRN